MKKNPLVVAGIHAVEEAVSTGKTFLKVYFLKDNRNEKLHSIEKKCRQLDIPVFYVPREKLNHLTQVQHQGIVGLLSPIEFHQVENLTRQMFEEGKHPVYLYFDRITDIRNLGAIARSAYYFGINALLLPVHETAAINEDSIKTSAGALLRIPVCLITRPVIQLKYLRDSGFRLIGAHEKAEKTIAEADFSLPVVIILGSEHQGIQSEILRLVSEEYKIPGVSDFDSLNVSVAAGIICYEMMKQRKSLERPAGC